MVEDIKRKLGRNSEPSARVIDSQPVKTTEACGPMGFEAGKRVKGRKRLIIIDANELVLGGEVREASIQDPDGAVELLVKLRIEHPSIEKCPSIRWIQGKKLKEKLANLDNLDIEVHPRNRETMEFLPIWQ